MKIHPALANASIAACSHIAAPVTAETDWGCAQFRIDNSVYKLEGSYRERRENIFASIGIDDESTGSSSSRNAEILDFVERDQQFISIGESLGLTAEEVARALEAHGFIVDTTPAGPGH